MKIKLNYGYNINHSIIDFLLNNNNIKEKELLINNNKKELQLIKKVMKKSSLKSKNIKLLAPWKIIYDILIAIKNYKEKLSNKNLFVEINIPNKDGFIYKQTFKIIKNQISLLQREKLILASSKNYQNQKNKNKNILGLIKVNYVVLNISLKHKNKLFIDYLNDKFIKINEIKENNKKIIEINNNKTIEYIFNLKILIKIDSYYFLTNGKYYNNLYLEYINDYNYNSKCRKMEIIEYSDDSFNQYRVETTIEILNSLI